VYSATIPDLLRLLVVPVLGWAAVRDIKTRRVPNRTWLPLAALGLVLLCWDAAALWTETVWWLTADGLQVGLEARSPHFTRTLDTFLIRTAFSVGFLVPFAYGFWWFGGFGGADAKALMTLAVVFPVFPIFYGPGFSLPYLETTLGVFSLTILSNTVLAGVIYPLALAGRNLLGGAVSKMMIIGRPLPVALAPERYGRLLERPGSYTRHGLDLDVLRMYLSWRDLDFEALLDDPERYRDPESLPAEPNDPGDGTIDSASGSLALTDGGSEAHDSETESRDEWGAEAFFEDIGGPIYGTDAEELRAGLTVLTEQDRVWYTPGIPFIVPMFGGLLISLTVGDVLVWLLTQIGIG
jgi:preflagellin peptidase FlaK